MQDHQVRHETEINRLLETLWSQRISVAAVMPYLKVIGIVVVLLFVWTGLRAS